MPTTPIRILEGNNDEYPSDPVRVVNWDAFVTALLTSMNLTAEDTVALSTLIKNTVSEPITLAKTEALVGGVMRVSIGWSEVQVNIDGTWLTLPAGTKVLNTADVASPTLYYIYARNINGVATVVSSTLDPEDDPGVNYEYAWIATCRFKSVAGTSTMYYIRRAYCALDLLLHHAGEWDLYNIPSWQSGGAISIDSVTGDVDMTELFYKRLRFEGSIDAINGGPGQPMLYGDEAGSVANLESITTYRDGSAITGGKYIKLLLGVITSPILDFPYMVIRQNKPAVEYATRAAALIDAERVAGSTFPDAYRANVIPLAYVIMLKGDASDLETVDLRGNVGGAGGGGGGTPVADHSLLSNLGADDHLQYLRADGTRTLTDDMLVTAGKTIDGVDISALSTFVTNHSANPVAHQNKVTLGADADVLFGLTDQQIDLDPQSANKVLASPAAGVPADPTFRALVSDDIPSLLAAKISNFDEAAQDAVGGMVVSNNDIVLTYVDATPSLEATLKTTSELQVPLVNGANNNVNIGTALLIYISGPTGSFNITGLTGGYAGRKVFLYNTTGNNMTITNESGSSLAANRILTLATAATSGTGMVELIYSGIAQRWIVVGVHS